LKKLFVKLLSSEFRVKTMCFPGTFLLSACNVITVGDDIELVDRGVRLEILLKICEDIKAGRLKVPNDGKKRSHGECIVDALVKPVTARRKCSFATYLHWVPETRNFVGRCNTFLSHPWSANFQDTVAALEEYEKTLPSNSPPKYYFVDYLAVNQHSPLEDLNQLKDIVELCDSLTLMAQPWNNPVALTRLWCIFEIAHAVSGKTDIEIILCPEDREKFQDKIRENINDVWGLVGEFFKNINSRKATATKPKDIEKIQQIVENKLGGFKKVDTDVADGLRNWFIRSAKALLKNFPDADKCSNEYAELCWQVAEFLYSQSKYSEAARLYHDAEVIYKNNKNNRWLTCEKDRIFMFRKMEKFKEAVEMAESNVENQEKILGPTHLSTLKSKRCLGAIQKDLALSYNEKAEQNLREILEVFMKAPKPDELQINTTKYQLAELLRNLGKLKEAQEMYQDVINSKVKNKKEWGPNHPSTLNCVLMKARCIALAGNHKRALIDYTNVLPILRVQWGADDPSVVKGNKWIEEAEAELKGTGENAADQLQRSRRSSDRNIGKSYRL